MKKSLLLSLNLVLLGAVHAEAKTTIEMPLMGEYFPTTRGSEKAIPLASLNAKLKAKGLPGFPETVAFGKNDAPWAKKLAKMTEEAAAALGLKGLSLFQYGHVGYYMYELPESTCYRGETSEVRKIIDSLMGTVFNLDQGIQAMRFGTAKYIYPDYIEDFFETNPEVRADDEESNPSEVAVWDKYDTSSDSILIMSDYGTQGDGTELRSVEIKRCK